MGHRQVLSLPRTGALGRTSLVVRRGRIARISGLSVEASGIRVPVGELCSLHSLAGAKLTAEAVGFSNGHTVLMPLGPTAGLSAGDEVVARGERLRAPVGERVLGRVLNGFGRPLDGRGDLGPGPLRPLEAEAPDALQRARIDTPFSTGVRVLDGTLTLAEGQRVGIFAGAGVGKSTLLGKITREGSADVAVVALIGERGREVREFLDHALGRVGREKSVVVVATGDTPAIERVNAAHMAVSIAEYFRAQGRAVLFVMDSVTRYAGAVRELGLAAGEPPTTKGYPPSLYARLPRLVERLGMSGQGCITALLTVLVEGDDLQDPVADALRSLLDGHIVLSRALAERGHFPAVDVLASVSRTLDLVTKPEHRARILELRQLLSLYRGARDLIDIGAYKKGANPDVDRAVRLMPSIEAYLCQGIVETSTFEGARTGLTRLLADRTRSEAR